MAIALGVLGVIVFGSAAAFFATNGDRDIPGFIDDQRVIEVASRECRLMTSTVDNLSVDGSPADRLAALADQNTAITTMVDRIRSLEPEIRRGDRPLEAWLEDWEALVSGREDYLGERRRGRPADFIVPTTSDGDPITVRMNDAGADVCRVPKVLLKPDLAGASAV